MRSVKAAELVFDYELYPRNNIDSHNVRCIMDAMEAGEELPPVIICRKTKRIVDGFHRVKAVLKRDENGMVTVIEKTYRNDSELFLDAMRYNATHGARLDPCDRTHCVIISERLHIPMESVAGALHVPADKLGELHNTRMATSMSGLSIPLKRTISHMAGRRLNKAQSEANDRLSGMTPAFYANQLITLIENNLLDKEDEKMLERLRQLHGLLETLLAAA